MFAPVRFIGKTFFSFGGMLGKLKMAVMAVVGIAVGMFLILVVLINGLLSICRAESTSADNILIAFWIKADCTIICTYKLFFTIMGAKFRSGDRGGSREGSGTWHTVEYARRYKRLVACYLERNGGFSKGNEMLVQSNKAYALKDNEGMEYIPELSDSRWEQQCLPI